MFNIIHENEVTFRILLIICYEYKVRNRIFCTKNKAMKEHKIFFEEQFTYIDENPFYV